MLSDFILDKIERVAQRATPGRWERWVGTFEVMAGPVAENDYGRSKGGRGDICECSDMQGRAIAERNANYIATLHPGVAQRLVEDIRTLRALVPPDKLPGVTPIDPKAFEAAQDLCQNPDYKGVAGVSVLRGKKSGKRRLHVYLTRREYMSMLPKDYGGYPLKVTVLRGT